MKLWQKSYLTAQEIETFTVGKDANFDLQLAPYDVLGSLAHAAMLRRIDLLTDTEYTQLQTGLLDIYAAIQADTFQIEPGVEDIHSQVEFLLTERYGEVGKKLHSGRSRNDQVLVDLRLYFRAEITEIVQLTQSLFDLLQQQSERYADVPMPGYTHTQVAMISSFGLWFGAYAETLVDDLQLLQAVYNINNQNPLGSAAGYGSSFPLDRAYTTQLLGFADLNYNVVHAQMGRGKTEQFLAFSLAAFGATLGRLANDICTFSSQNFGFVRLPDSYTTGSSIMPHKKNPDVFEILRAKCNLLQALPGQLALLTNNLLTGYHRDLQLTKEVIFPALTDLKSCLRIAQFALKDLHVNPDSLVGDHYQYLYTVEEVNRLVLSGTPFRDAYHQVGQAVEAGTFVADPEVAHTHAGSIGHLCHAEIQQKWDRVVAGFASEQVEEALVRLIQREK
ncbi:MAG: argininosuccinate lyase [Bacteroidota bacterium]